MAQIQNRIKAGSSIDLVLEVLDEERFNQDLVTVPTVEITNPKGETSSGGSSSREDLGVYVLPYQTLTSAIRGWYTGTFVFPVGARTVRVPVTFEVV